MGFLYCAIYIIGVGVLVWLCGRILPRKWVHENAFPFNTFKWEKGGKIYEKVGVHKWKTKLPDASVILNKIIPGIMPKKRMDSRSQQKVATLIKESCIAEWNHFISGILGFVCVKLWKGVGGWIMSILWAIWNVPFILIQRYNRPRLKKLFKFYERHNVIGLDTTTDK